MNKQKKVVLLHGGSVELVQSVARMLFERDTAVALCHPQKPERSVAMATQLAEESGGEIIDVGPLPPGTADSSLPAQIVAERWGQLDGVANLYVPDPECSADDIAAFIKSLETRMFSTAEFMVQIGSQGIIVNQFLLATLFADSPLAAAAASARGALTGLTRAACVRFGAAGVRIVGLLAGLLDLPETRALASDRVKETTTPLGRWVEADDIAATVAFLTLSSGYISGQMLVLDGGMTSGVNGA